MLRPAGGAAVSSPGLPSEMIASGQAAQARFLVALPRSSAILAKSILDYLNLHYGEDTKINQLSEEFHFTADYLSKLFKKHFTISPKEHIQQLRTNRAMELLVMTDMPVSQVAEAVGFRDMSVFFRTMKDRTGMSPRALRTSFKYTDASGDGNDTLQ